MELDRESCQRARKTRDPRFDGRFFIAVKTTAIYCRPICPAPSPKEENVEYYPSAAAAAQAGYRPCLRCRPEASPGTPAWLGTSATVSRALRLIEESALDEDGVESLAQRLGVGSRHLRNLFVAHLGAPPVTVAQTRRSHFAKKLIDETDLPFTEIAMAAGFGSIRRFNFVFRQMYGRSPGELRRLIRKRPACRAGSYRLRLPFRPPYEWQVLLEFLAARAIPGVESVDDGVYRRTIELNGAAGEIEVSLGTNALELQVAFPETRMLFLIVERVRRLFDLRADPQSIESHFRNDPVLGHRVRKRPGLRVPGAWDGFELAIRAILGQQISVKGASTLSGRIARAYGAPFGNRTLFPSREILARAPIEECGVTRARAATIRALAESDLTWESAAQPTTQLERLQRIAGIGPWTAQYIAMRAFGEPDAFPGGDLVLQRATRCRNTRELEIQSESWRPWRSYAAIHLWQGVKDDVGVC
ncbi:MAG TPA: AlkA N-terminal domain-containing protein [Bryobacteraceae bacterium]|nr:AlkA N-terminal domain-containing protein [Bryobacteraceae bacterium]